MWIADNWKDYEVIDTSNGEKLERWGDYLLVRPEFATFSGISKQKFPYSARFSLLFLRFFDIMYL